MSHEPMRHDRAADRPRSQLPPIEALLVKLEELDDYSHIALRQYPKAERTTRSLLGQLSLKREARDADHHHP